MNLLQKLWDKGELPDAKVSIEIDQPTLSRLAVTIVVVAVIIILFSKASQRF